MANLGEVLCEKKESKCQEGKAWEFLNRMLGKDRNLFDIHLTRGIGTL